LLKKLLLNLKILLSGKTLSISDQIAIYAMVVDAVNDNARGFYKQFGFVGLSDDSPRLFLPLKSFETKPGPIK